MDKEAYERIERERHETQMRANYANQELPEAERLARINMIRKSWGLEPQV